MKLNNTTKAVMLIVFLGVSIVGFLIKLPPVFRHIDKEMHTLFYFAAAAFLNTLVAGRNIVKHAALFVVLYLFGIGIEWAQEYSNKLFHQRMHGRYDVEDVHANLKGLLLFSLCWISYVLLSGAYMKLKPNSHAGVAEVG